MKYCYPCKYIPPELAVTESTISKIAQIVCGYYHMKVADVRSKRRTTEICITRQTIVYLCSKNLTHTAIEVVMKFVKQHRTSHYYTIKTVKDQLLVNKRYHTDVDKIQHTIDFLKLKQLL